MANSFTIRIVSFFLVAALSGCETDECDFEHARCVGSVAENCRGSFSGNEIDPEKLVFTSQDCGANFCRVGTFSGEDTAVCSLREEPDPRCENLPSGTDKTARANPVDHSVLRRERLIRSAAGR